MSVTHPHWRLYCILGANCFLIARLRLRSLCAVGAGGLRASRPSRSAASAARARPEKKMLHRPSHNTALGAHSSLLSFSFFFCLLTCINNKYLDLILNMVPYHMCTSNMAAESAPPDPEAHVPREYERPSTRRVGHALIFFSCPWRRRPPSSPSFPAPARAAALARWA